MGIYDRDYMHERGRESQKRNVRRALNPRRSKAFKFVWFALATIAIYFGAKHALDFRDRVPFPTTGQVLWYIQPAAQQVTGNLTISAPSGKGLNYAVRLDEWATGKPVTLITVRSGETATTPIPLGRYRVTIAKGKTWLGPSKLFGIGGDVREAVDPLDFYRSNQQTFGHRINLDAALRGNMETRPIWFRH